MPAFLLRRHGPNGDYDRPRHRRWCIGRIDDMEERVEARKRGPMHVKSASWLAAALLIPPVGIAVALRIDGQSPGPLSDLAFWALPVLGLVILLPKINGWIARSLVAIVYVLAELGVMFVVGVSLACAWYRACL